MRFSLLAKITFGTLLSTLSFSVASQTLSGPTNLRSEPTAEARIIKQLVQGAEIKIIKRQGFYLEIESAGSKGWIKASEVSLSKPQSSALSNIDTGRTGKGNIVSTSAARGLSSKELLAAKPDFQQTDQLKSFAVSPQASQDFAGQGGLQTRKLVLLAKPPEPKSISGKPSPVSTSSKLAPNAATKARKKSADDDDDDE